MKVKTIYKGPDKSKMKRLACAVSWDTKSITKSADGQITIEGFANTSNKDRVDDIILPKAFVDTLKEYMENPILLFQHDWDKVIGKVIEAKVIDDENAEIKGLWVKAVISGAKDVEDVRTKIKEGSLKTFSIGYNELEADWDKSLEANVVSKVELLEISVVSIPCNPFAKFSASGEEKDGIVVSKDILKELSKALNELDETEEVTAEFLEEVINILAAS